MLSFIRSTQNVFDDDNCGYRSLALLLDLQEDEYPVRRSHESLKKMRPCTDQCAWLNEDALIPPPQSAWKRYRNEDVAGWKNFFSDRIDTWCQFRMQVGRRTDPFV
ncbi:hypothetical protein V2J09_004156 [Rumex salicifolius]